MKVIAKTATKAARGKNLEITWGLHDFPTGEIMVAQTDEGICYLGINCGEKKLAKEWPGATLTRDDKATAKTAKEILKGWPGDFSNVTMPLVLYGTDFQLKVWRELLKIKSGKTTTYQDIAKKLGKPTASRAVGSAVGKNTISIVVPCHRVINKSGSRVNYAWGPEIKLALLKGEGAKV